MKRSAVLLLGSALGLALAASPPLRAKTELIYSLDTTCTIGQGKPQPCQVEALEVGVRNAWINFGTNELCFNDRAFCVVNPTFLADVKADAEGPAFEERQTVGLAFGPSGRVDIACFDDGCRRLLEAIGR